MSESKIEWTDRTWNPIVGCSRVSPGCQHCYAERMAKRLQAIGVRGYEQIVNEHGRWNGSLTIVESVLAEPLRRKKPTMYFVNSMSDLFHEGMPHKWIHMIFGIMAFCPQHAFQILTKRANMLSVYMGGSFSGPMIPRQILKGALDAGVPEALVEGNQDMAWPLRNVWLGVSVEDQERACRIDVLRDVPAAIRFIAAVHS